MVARLKYYYFFVFVILASVIFLAVTVSAKPTVTINNNKFQVELALTDEQHKQGLSNRTSLAENTGMLFVFASPDKYNFWMKDTLIPLDIIWLDDNAKAIYIRTNLQPCLQENCPSFGPKKPAKYVLELNAGQAEKINLKIGDQVVLNLHT